MELLDIQPLVSPLDGEGHNVYSFTHFAATNNFTLGGYRDTLIGAPSILLLEIA